MPPTPGRVTTSTPVKPTTMAPEPLRADLLAQDRHGEQGDDERRREGDRGGLGQLQVAQGDEVEQASSTAASNGSHRWTTGRRVRRTPRRRPRVHEASE